MKKTVLFLLSITFLFPLNVSFAETFNFTTDTTAYQSYARRPQSELSKLIYLLDLFQGSANRVYVNGREYNSEEASPIAKKYLRRHYKRKQAAKDWIIEHCYRTPGSGDIINYQQDDGSLKPLRDVLLDALKQVEKLPISK